jgi:hypothetical protein
MNVATLKYIALGLFLICVIWLIRIVVKREAENLIRTVLLGIIFLAIFFYLSQQKSEKITFADIKAQIQETFFPERPLHYVYYKDEGTRGVNRYLRYTFESPGPKLSLTMDKDQKYFHIKDVRSVNRVLEYLGLPKVKNAVPELASITGSRNDINLYRWNDYPLGILTVERDICQDRDKLESYQCISAVVVTNR